MRKVRWVVVAAVCCLVAGLCFLETYSLFLKRRADHLVRVSYGFAERERPPGLDEIRRAFGSDLQQLGPCSHDGCGYEVNVSNRLLHTLHLAPFTELRTQFWQEKNVMQSNSMYFYSMPTGMVDILVKYCSSCDSPNVNPYGTSAKFVTGYVEIDLSAPDTARRRAFGINTACLSKWGGCTSVAQLLPTIWRQTETDRIMCIIPNHDGVFD